MRRLIAVLFALMLLVSAPQPAAAYDVKDYGWRVSTALWHDWQYRIPVCFVGDPVLGYTWDLNKIHHQVINEAMADINAVDTELFYYRATAQCSWYAQQGLPYAGITVTYDSPKPNDPGTTNPIVATSWGTCGDRPWGTTKCTIRSMTYINRDKLLYWGLSAPTNTGRYDVFMIVLHELLHPAGIGHSAYPWATMYPTMGTDERRYLKADDKNAIHKMYGWCGQDYDPQPSSGTCF